MGEAWSVQTEGSESLSAKAPEISLVNTEFHFKVSDVSETPGKPAESLQGSRKSLAGV